jgi:GTP-binding protein EngB required for normal cell division
VEAQRQHTFDRISRHLPLLSLIDVAKELDCQRIEREARALADRVADKRFFVVCLGQFKRGKSSLLNALVGTTVLPTGIVPVTAIVTILRHGPIPHAEVHFENGSRQNVRVDSVSDFVSEDRNPENFRGVAAVEIFVPAPLLASGMCLVDTPGLGSIYSGNTAVTKAFVPHIDAALIVLGADPPMSGDELMLLEELASQVEDMVFVLSKADRLTARECDEAIEFARRTLAQKIKGDVGHVFQVSAAEWLNRTASSRDAPALLAELERLARDSGPALVNAAETRGVGRISASLLREIENLRDALIAPAEESRRVAACLREVIADAERSLSDLGHLFKAEQERVNRRCTERRDGFLARTIAAAREECHDAILKATEPRGSRLHYHATQIAQSISRRLLNQWLEEERPAAEAMYRESAHRFVQLTNDFLKRVAESGDPRLAHLPSALSEEPGFRVRGKLYFGEHFGFPRKTIVAPILDIFRSRRAQLEIIEKKVAQYLVTLLSLNSTRILNDFDAIVRESGRRLEAEIRGMLNELRATAESTLARAEATRAAGTEAVRSSLEHLQHLRAKIMLASEQAVKPSGDTSAP